MPFVRKNPFFAREPGPGAQHQLLQEVEAFPGQDTCLPPIRVKTPSNRRDSIVEEGLTIRELLQ